MLAVVVVVVGGAGGDTVLRQELFQVHVLQLEGVSVVGQRLVPQRGAQEGRLGGAALLIQGLLLLLLAESCEERISQCNQQSKSLHDLLLQFQKLCWFSGVSDQLWLCEVAGKVNHVNNHTQTR